MKNKVKNYVKYLGGKSYYSGKSKTLFIYDPWHTIDWPMQSIEGAVFQKFGYSLHFKIQTINE